MRDDVVRRVEDIRGGAVILLELDYVAVREILLELENIADIRAAPAVNRLVVVADDAHVMPLSCQQAHEHILRVVRILIFVHVDIVEPVAVRLQHRRMLHEQFERFNEQIVEIQRVRAAQTVLVLEIVIVNHLAAVIAVGLLEPLVRTEQAVFRIGNLRPHFLERQDFIVDIELFAKFLQHGHLVVVVVDGETAGIPQAFDIAPQNARAAGMKRGNPHIPGLIARQPVDALAHFLGRLVCECDGQNLRGGHAQFQKMRDTAGQRAGFARACARQDQHRSLSDLHGLSLLRVQRAQIHFQRSSFSSLSKMRR